MKSEWKECTIGDIGTIVTGKTPSTRHAEWWGGAVPFVTPKDIQGTKHCLATERYVTEAGVGVVASAKLPPHAVCVSCIGNIGYVAMTTKECISNQQVNSIIVNEKYDCDFVYYLMKSLWPFFKNYEGQSTALSILNKTAFSRLSVSTPPLPTQRKIAAVLSSLDDKIETNNAICRNLEEQMGILYGAFVEQKAWKKSHIGELAERIAMGPFGSNIKVSTFVNEGVPIISGNHLRGKFVEDCGFNFITESHAQKLNRSLVQAGDIVFTHAGTLGQVSMVPDDADYGEYIISQRQFFLRCNQEKALPLFVLLFFHSKWGQWQLLSYANQTGVPSIAQPATNLRKIEIPLPPINAQREWAKCVQPLVDEFRVLWQQNRRLAALRDTLLPRLMSGKLDVSTVKHR